MAEETQSQIYDVKVIATDALKQLADLKLQSKGLRDQQKELGKVTEENAEQYYALGSQIKAIDQQAAAYQKQITNSIKLQNQQEASLEKLRTQLSLDNAEFVKLGDSAEDAFRKNELGARIAATTAELKRQEEALGDHRRSVGDYAKATRELRVEQQSLIDTAVAMAAAGDTTSGAYQDVIARASEFKRAQELVNQEINNTAKGTETIQAIAGAAQGASAAYGLWVAATAVLGTENEEVEKTLKKMMTVITALNSLTAISNTLSKTGATYRAAENIMQKINNSLLLQNIKAQAAKNATTVSGAVATKAAAAATWLWNAALAANPVVLIGLAVAALTLGVAALTGAFSKNADASKTSERAARDYEAQLKRLDEQIRQTERANEERNQQAAYDRRKELLELKENAATKEDLLTNEYNLNKKVRDAEIKGLEDMTATLNAQNSGLEKNIKEWEKNRRTLNLSEEDLEKLTKQIDDAQKRFRDNLETMGKNEETVKNLLLDQAEDDLTYQNRVADQTYERLDKQLTATLQYQQEVLKSEGQYQSQDFAKRQAHEVKVFKLQQDAARERLQLQLKYKKITADEYAAGLALIEAQNETFANKQTNDLNNYFKTVRDNIVKLVGSTDLQIAEVITAYDKAMKELTSVEAPIRLPGMSDEDFAEAMDAYEGFLFERAELEKRLTAKMEEDIQTIKDNSIEEQVKRIEKAISREYKDDFEKFANNERKKLQLTIDSLEKQKAAKEKEGLDTYAEDAALQTARSAMIALNLNADLMLTGKNAKARYDLRKKALEAERELYKDNADEQLRIDRELFENEQDLFEARIQAFSDYASAVGDMLSALNDLFAALDERESQRIEEKYAKQQEDLDNALKGHLISQSVYDKKVKKLEEDKAKEEAKLKREQAVRDRIAALFNIAVNTATGIMSAVASFPLTGGLPWSAIVAALGAVQAAAVLAQPLPKAAKGKYITGKTHAAGGTIIEAEAGETIINRKSTSMFLPLLSAINEMGGGVPFTTVGSDGGYALRSAYMSGGGISRSEMGEEIRDALKDLQIITTVEDYRRADENYVNIKDRGTV